MSFEVHIDPQCLADSHSGLEVSKEGLVFFSSIARNGVSRRLANTKRIRGNHVVLEWS